jgi:hypothetical protein
MNVPRPLPLNPAQGSTETTPGEPVRLGSPVTRRSVSPGASPVQADRPQVALATDDRQGA